MLVFMATCAGGTQAEIGLSMGGDLLNLRALDVLCLVAFLALHRGMLADAFETGLTMIKCLLIEQRCSCITSQMILVTVNAPP
jgi:hypothetical protein